MRWLVGGLFPNAWTVAVREYRLRVRSRLFQIATLVVALVGIGIALIPLGMQALGFDEASQVSIYASSPDTEQGAAALAGTLNGLADGVSNIEATVVTDPEAARTDVQEGTSSGLVTIDRDASGSLTFDLYTGEGPTSTVVYTVTAAASQVAVADRLVQAGVDPGQVGEIFAPTEFNVTPVDPGSVDPEEAFGPRYLLATVLVILMFMAVIMYGQWVASSVIEEKASRVMELLITAATPRQLLFGKVLGSGGAGLTQYIVIVGAALLGLFLQEPLSRLLLGETGGSGIDVQGLDLYVLIVVGLFFVGGFGLYASLYAALGSTASRQEEIQTISGPMVIIGMAGYFAAFFALTQPDADWVRVLSFVPFFSPYLIPTRLILGSIAPWEIGLALVFLVLGVLLALWVAARVYSAGVLLYGQRTGLRNVWRAMRTSR
jgi:ABC-2 type transport system permease protein